ncbi:MAG TPA: hypothetical protein VFW40_14050, partial [Capsulimonadaceae bacterium]|nr:hypothetical protein [Capsulimonadaceae bacterium]
YIQERLKDTRQLLMIGLVIAACFCAVFLAGCSHSSSDKINSREDVDATAPLTDQEKGMMQKMKTDPKSPEANNTATIMSLPPSQRAEMYREMVAGSMKRVPGAAAIASPSSNASAMPPSSGPAGDK